MARLTIIKGFFIVLLGALSLNVFANTNSCIQLLEPSRQAKLLERLQKLNPEIHQRYLNKSFSTEVLEELYLDLKTEAWRFLPNGQMPWKGRAEISFEQAAHIKNAYAKHYSTEKLTEDGLYLFYANAVWSLYISVYQSWLSEVVEGLAKGAAVTREQKSFGVSLLSRGLIDFDLQSPMTQPENAQSIFIAKAWEKFPWAIGFQLAGEWQSYSESNQVKATYDSLREWLNQNSAYQAMTPAYKNSLVEALRNPGTEEVCCLTNPGCAFCPNNRLSRRSKD